VIYGGGFTRTDICGGKTAEVKRVGTRFQVCSFQWRLAFDLFKRVARGSPPKGGKSSEADPSPRCGHFWAVAIEAAKRAAVFQRRRRRAV